MIPYLLLVLVIATMAHELTHYALLRRAGVRPRACVRALPIPAPGWRFDPSGLDHRRLRWMWLAGPFAGLETWVLAGLILPGFLLPCPLVGVAEYAGNMALPGSDGRRAMGAMVRARLPGARRPCPPP